MCYDYRRIKNAILALALTIVFSPIILANPLRVLSWNIEWFPGLRAQASADEQQAHLKAVRPELAKIKPDILLAQEITDEQAFNKLVTVVPDMKVHIISRFLEPDSDKPSPQQLAIASRLEAHSAWFEPFKPSQTAPYLRRGFAFAALHHPDGGLLMLYSVHLKSNRGSDTPEGARDIAVTRRESVRQIIAHKAEMEKKFAGEKIRGWLVGGDFNTNDDGQFPLCTAIKDMVAAGFHNTWSETPKAKRLTWREDPDPARRFFSSTTFDFIFTSGFKPVQARIIDVPRALSDHYPIGILLESE